MSAIASSLISLSILFVLHTVNFLIFETHGSILLTPLTVGTAELILAALAALCVFTRPSRDTTLTTTVLLMVCTVWTAVGLSNISWEMIIPKLYERNISVEEYSQRDVLLPGHGVLIVLYFIFSVCLILHNKKKDMVVFMLVASLLSVCVIINTWTNFKGHSLLFLSLAFVTAYVSVRAALEHFTGNTETKPSDNKTNFDDKRVIRYALNVLSLSPWVLRSSTLTKNTVISFIWPLVSGLFLLFHGISGMRRGNTTISTYSIVDGLFWASLGGSMYITVIKDFSEILFPAVSIPLSMILLTIAAVSLHSEILLSLEYVLLSGFMLTLTFKREVSLAAFTWICFVVYMYGYIASLFKSFSFKIQLPVGQKVFSKLRQKFCMQKILAENKVEMVNSSNVFESDPMLGISKYATLENIGYVSNIISVLSFSWVPHETTLLSLPWQLIFGCFIQFVVGFIGFSRGKTLESSFFLIFASFWSIWGSLRSLDLIGSESGMSLGVGLSGFLLVGVVFLGMSITVNKVWIGISLCFVLFMLTSLLQVLGISDGFIYEKTAAVLYSLSLFYALLSSTLKLTFVREVLPSGKPLLQISKITKYNDQILLASSRRARGVKEIAEKLKTGGICGIPTDTVYILAACCHQPKAVERAYKSKKHGKDRPMSVWISNFKQIEVARHEFSSLLWDFLHEIWPSNVSVVVKRGEWVKSLGLGESEKYVGRSDSIALRIPDSTITCHLIDQCGPVTVTSANPTGEGDTTHHLQVLAKLGIEMCDGILCDGPSRENAISTVVDCRDIDNEKLGFFRIGLTPKSAVLGILHKLLEKRSTTNGDSHMNGIANAAFDTKM
ncbi:uncharacterized protein LOC133189689 [Saccostrea echinata]|uniref:uncharacterized protein LOC133189689 n=1 Tax=Saccostrea echinata TaxID=191078 RepID=UPI002A834AE3|nr:uncharacterized protein LOC133189689 [Saccostrea echinata]